MAGEGANRVDRREEKERRSVDGLFMLRSAFVG
jgi:hypothetical protein